MKLDLADLHRLHPLLPEATAAEYIHRAALALQRRHTDGVSVAAELQGLPRTVTVHWPSAAMSDAEQLDRHRVTEDAAEAIALVFVQLTRGWVVRRRLQRGDHADWLLLDRSGQRVAMEVSGTDDSDDTQRLREKLDQVAKCTAAGQRAACVVRFVEPRLSLQLMFSDLP